MPYPKLKAENYENFGGINRKLSTYLTGPQEFLNLQNVDFRTTGALSSFCGSTQSVLGGITGPVTGACDFFTGFSTFPASYMLAATGSSFLYNTTGGTFQNIHRFIFAGQTNSFSFLKSTVLYGANNYDFFKYPGSSVNAALQYSLPKPYNISGIAGSTGAGGLSGQIRVYWAFVRYDGLLGPINDHQQVAPVGNFAINVLVPRLWTTFGTQGISNGSFGLSYLRVWYSFNGSDPQSNVNPVALTDTTYTITDAFTGFTQFNDFDDYFGTFLYGNNSDNGATFGLNNYQADNPDTIEIYANSLFSAGFRFQPDTVWFSRPGEFEKHDLDAFFDYRANDGDKITLLKNYFSQLVIFKSNTIGTLTGTNADDFTLSEVNNQYGNLSNNSSCIFNQRLWFLDKKGVCEYNGANTRIVSDRVEYIFLRMNINVARTTAMMIHVKERNEVWCAIPIDGSTTNNIIVVYDYIADAWTTRTVNNCTYLTNYNQGATKPVTVFGDASGMIYSYGQSLLTDNGSAFTSIVKTGFNHDMGHSVEKMYRRLFVDAAIPSGATYDMLVNFYTNQGSSPALTMTFAISEFQKRLDFGLSAKDMSVEFIYSQGNFLKLNGYTIEYRFQRAV